MPWIGSLVAAIGVTLGDGLFRRKRKYAIAVNAAVQFLTTYLTGMMYFLLGGLGAGSRVEQFLVSPNVSIFLPLIVAAFVHTFTNVSMLVPAMLAKGRVVPQATLTKLVQWDLVSTLFFTPLSFYIFLIYGTKAEWSLIPPLLFLLVCWVLVQEDSSIESREIAARSYGGSAGKITQISKAINAAGLNPEEILDIVLINGMMVCGAPAAAIRLFDPSPRGEVCELIRPNSEHWMKFFQSQSFQAIVNDVIESGSSLLIDEFRVDNLGDWFSSAYRRVRAEKFSRVSDSQGRYGRGDYFRGGQTENVHSDPHGNARISVRRDRDRDPEREDSPRNSLQYTRKEEEIRLAERVQRHVLPKKYVANNIRVEGEITPARVLSGDFFDVIELDGDTVGITMGDVSGKGVPARLR